MFRMRATPDLRDQEYPLVVEGESNVVPCLQAGEIALRTTEGSAEFAPHYTVFGSRRELYEALRGLAASALTRRPD